MKYLKSYKSFLTEGKHLLKQSKLSSDEYQKAKKLKGFDPDNYEWNGDEQLYVKINEGKADGGKMAKTHVVYSMNIEKTDDSMVPGFRVSVKKGSNAEEKAKDLAKEYFGDEFKSILSISKALNPEKSDVSESLNENKDLGKLLKDLEKELKGHDWYYNMSDDMRYVKKGKEERNSINKLIKEIHKLGGASESKKMWKKLAPTIAYTSMQFKYPEPTA